MVQAPGLADKHALEIRPVSGSGGERLHDDEVLGRTGSQGEARLKLEASGALHRRCLEGQSAQRNVEPDPGGIAQQDDAQIQGELERVGNPRLVLGQEGANERLLTSEAGEQREVGVHRLAGFAPAEQREASDETEAPVVSFAERLESGGGA